MSFADEIKKMENELYPPAIFFVLRMIWNSVDYGGSVIFFYDFLLFNDMSEFGVPESGRIKWVLKWLEAQKIIKTQSVDNESYKRPVIMHDEYSLKPPEEAWRIELLDKEKFRKLFREYHGAQIEAAKRRPAYCKYDKKTGTGYIRMGEPFKVSGKINKKLFDALYENSGEFISKSDILKLIDSQLLVKHKQSTIVVNTAVSNLRKIPELTKKEIVVENGNIMLNIRKQF